MSFLHSYPLVLCCLIFPVFSCPHNYPIPVSLPKMFACPIFFQHRSMSPNLPLLFSSIPSFVPILFFFPCSKKYFPILNCCLPRITTLFHSLPHVPDFLPTTFHPCQCSYIFYRIWGRGGGSDVLGGVIFDLFLSFDLIFHDLVSISIKRRSSLPSNRHLFRSEIQHFFGNRLSRSSILDSDWLTSFFIFF